MKQKFFLTTIITWMFIGSALGQFPNFPSRPVLDEANTLSKSQVTYLNEKVEAFETLTGMEIRLVIMKDVSPYETASAYTTKLYHHWKLGDKEKHNGLLLLIAQKIGGDSHDMKDYCRIMTGWGIVSIIPDTMVRSIKQQFMTTKLPSQPFLALDNTLDQLFTIIKNWRENHPEDNTVTPQIDIQDEPQKSEDTDLTWLWWLISIAVGIIIIILIIRWYKKNSGGGGSSSSSIGGEFFGFSSSCSSCGGGGCGGGD